MTKQHKGFGSVAICGQIKEGEYLVEGISKGLPVRRWSGIEKVEPGCS